MTTLVSISGRPADTESSAEPMPERYEEISAPLPQTSPAFGIDDDSKPAPNLALAQTLDKVQPERLENHARRVPATRMEIVGEHGNRPTATAAEVTAYPGDALPGGARDAKDLPRIGAVADDAERLPGLVGEMAAERAACGA